MSLPITIPNTFATETNNIPLSELDANFTTVTNAINGIGNGSEALANVAITGGTATNLTANVVSISNATITGGSITGITPLAVVVGGTGANSAATARTNLSAAASGANSDITSLSGLTTALSVDQGGTGSANLTANSVVIGNGVSAVSGVAPGTSGNVLTSNGTSWTSAITLGVGIGQTWQNVTGSRSLNTAYTNSTGKPIMVGVFYTSLGTSNNLTAVVDSVTVAGMVFSLSFGTLATGDSFSFIVPAGASYQINSSAAPTINAWSELR